MWDWIKANPGKLALAGGGIFVAFILLRPRPDDGDDDGGVFPLITPTAPFFGGGMGPSMVEGVIASDVDRPTDPLMAVPPPPGNVEDEIAKIADTEKLQDEAEAAEAAKLASEKRVTLATLMGKLRVRIARIRARLKFDPKEKPAQRRTMRERIATLREELAKAQKEFEKLGPGQ